MLGRARIWACSSLSPTLSWASGVEPVYSVNVPCNINSSFPLFSVCNIELNSMAAVRKIIQANKNKTLSPYLFAFRRGIAYKLFVGGLSFYTTEKALSDAFSNYGQVIEAKIITDRVSDRSKGFGFVSFASADEAENAIAEMKGKTLNGRVLFVDYAKPNINANDAMPIARGPPEPTPDT